MLLQLPQKAPSGIAVYRRVISHAELGWGWHRAILNAARGYVYGGHIRAGDYAMPTPLEITLPSVKHGRYMR